MGGGSWEPAQYIGGPVLLVGNCRQPAGDWTAVR
jgi:hypothetical protein